MVKKMYQGSKLTRNLSGNAHLQSSQLADPLWTDPDLKRNFCLQADLYFKKEHRCEIIHQTFPQIRACKEEATATSLILTCTCGCVLCFRCDIQSTNSKRCKCISTSLTGCSSVVGCYCLGEITDEGTQKWDLTWVEASTHQMSQEVYRQSLVNPCLLRSRCCQHLGVCFNIPLSPWWLVKLSEPVHDGKRFVCDTWG